MPNENEPEKSAKIISSNPQINIELTCGKDGEDESKLYDGLYKALEPFGDGAEQFAVLIRAAYFHIDPCNDTRLSNAALIALAKENNGKNNAYTDLQEMLQAFDEALGK